MSFTRKYPSTAVTAPSRSPLSTGLSSLDDLLGGGVPPSCSVVYTAPDLHSAYGVLVQKYFVAQGLAAGEKVCVVGETAEWVNGCMWVAPNAAMADDGEGEKMKIAWRYETMKPFETSVADDKTLDLTARIPPAVVSDALASGQLIIVDADAPLARLNQILAADTSPLRVCVPNLGDPQWGDLGAQDILRFLHGLRALLRRHPHAGASTSLVASMSGDSYGWHQRLGWVSDGSITLSAFSGNIMLVHIYATNRTKANPALAAAFPSAHGLVRLHNLPSPASLVPDSDRFSVIRGVSGGENNVGFRCTRKRLVFETMHLGVEGGVGERRVNKKKGVDTRVARFDDF